jgi:hypothetical protein
LRKRYLFLFVTQLFPHFSGFFRDFWEREVGVVLLDLSALSIHVDKESALRTFGRIGVSLLSLASTFLALACACFALGTALLTFIGFGGGLTFFSRFLFLS